jgi:hypothetical protein
MDQISQNIPEIHKCSTHSKAELPCCLAKQMLLNIVQLWKTRGIHKCNITKSWTYTLFYRTKVVKESAVNLGLNYIVNYQIKL